MPVVPLKEIASKKVKAQLYLARCRTAITTVQYVLGWLSHSLTISAKVPLLTV